VETLNINTPDTYVTPSITMVFTPIWAKVAPANSKERVKIAILKRMYEYNQQVKLRAVLRGMGVVLCAFYILTVNLNSYR
jgi:hypothetical protein